MCLDTALRTGNALTGSYRTEDVAGRMERNELRTVELTPTQ